MAHLDLVEPAVLAHQPKSRRDLVGHGQVSAAGRGRVPDGVAIAHPGGEALAILHLTEEEVFGESDHAVPIEYSKSLTDEGALVEPVHGGGDVHEVERVGCERKPFGL